MPKPLHLGACLLLVPALFASACGSSETSTKSATTAPTVAQATTQATGATGVTGPNGVAPAPGSTTSTQSSAKRNPALPALSSPAVQKRLAEAKARDKALAKTFHLENGKRYEAPTPAFNTSVPKSKRYPPEIYKPFFAACERGKGAVPLCTCILVEEELSPTEKDRAIAEILSIQVMVGKGYTMKQIAEHKVQIATTAAHSVEACKVYV